MQKHSIYSIIFWLFLTVALKSTVINAANILFFSPVGSHSTRLSEWPLMEALADRNHSVTFVSGLKNFEVKKSKIKTYEPKLWTESFGAWDEEMNFYQLRKEKNLRALWFDLPEIGKQSCEKLYEDQEFVEWVKSSKFDLVIIDTSSNECAFGMVHLWKAKYALYTTTVYLPWYTDAYGLPDESSSVPSVAYNTFTNPMSFTERFLNAWDSIIFTWIRENDYLPALEEITKKGLGPELTKDLPSFVEMERNTNLVLLTSHFSLDYARSLPPHFIPVGGNVISQKKKPIPDDLQKFMDSSDGFIYISFGTVADFTQFDKQVQINFINALAEHPNTRFVWKSHNEINAAAIPKNVYVAKWVSQQTVLQHPKVKAYITHSGMGSTAEAVYFNIPLICIPVLGEQDFNAAITVKRGAGIRLEIIDMKQKDLSRAIFEILNNNKYREGMTRLSAMNKDRPVPSLETAVWWVEYLLRHDNTNEYLLPPSAHQRWYQRRQIDIWLASAIIALAVILIPTLLLYYIARKWCTATNRKLKKN